MELAHDGNVTAAIFLLKGLRPEKYRERYEHFSNINDFDPEKLTVEQLEKLMDAWLLKAYNGDQKAFAEAKKALLAGQPAPTVIETTAEQVS